MPDQCCRPYRFNARLLAGGALLLALAQPVLAAPAAGISTAAMDPSVRPGDDFYAYANGGWMKGAEIPADRAEVGGFLIADQQTERKLAELIAEIDRSSAPADSDIGRIRDYHRAYLDTAAIEKAGLAPLQPDLARFAAIGNVHELSRVLGEQLRADVDPINSTNFHTENLFGLFVTQALTGGKVVPYLLQGGLGMPEREYYLSADAKMADLRGKYLDYIALILSNGGIAAPARAKARALAILDLETKIAAAHQTRAESEDFSHDTALWSRAEFASRAPGIDWAAFFAAAGLGHQASFAAYHAAALPKLAALVASEPLAVWKDWLAFHQVSANANVLPAIIDADRFAFYGTALQGVSEPRPREKRAITALNGALGDALGRLYVEKYFPASAKADVEKMVVQIKQAFARRIAAIDWMAPATRKEALAKVRGIVVAVSYPDHWRDYSGMTLGADTAYANQQAASRRALAQQLAKIGKPLDRGEWWMNAQLVNAVNLPVQNALNFPAAILQPPFYDPAADAAFNYGAVGAVIGHEISHSFDNNGAAFDAKGALRNWWTKEDLAKFDAAGKALARQFDAYEPFPGLHVNGELTLGENIADVAGLAAAYDAYQASLGGKPAPTIGGLTGDQRFFLAFAQSWATKAREAALRSRLAVDGHSPGQYRALTVRNIDGWYKAFDIKPGDKLYLPPEQRARVW